MTWKLLQITKLMKTRLDFGGRVPVTVTERRGRRGWLLAASPYFAAAKERRRRTLGFEPRSSAIPKDIRTIIHEIEWGHLLFYILEFFSVCVIVFHVMCSFVWVHWFDARFVATFDDWNIFCVTWIIWWRYYDAISGYLKLLSWFRS